MLSCNIYVIYNNNISLIDDDGSSCLAIAQPEKPHGAVNQLSGAGIDLGHTLFVRSRQVGIELEAVFVSYRAALAPKVRGLLTVLNLSRNRPVRIYCSLLSGR
jgi:hypothetical protein